MSPGRVPLHTVPRTQTAPIAQTRWHILRTTAAVATVLAAAAVIVAGAAAPHLVTRTSRALTPAILHLHLQRAPQLRRSAMHQMLA